MESKFIKGLELCQSFFEEAVKPLISINFPKLKFDVALIGTGSEILGLDDQVSQDHHWGPRIQLFLSDTDLNTYKDELKSVLSENLPTPPYSPDNIVPSSNYAQEYSQQ